MPSAKRGCALPRIAALGLAVGLLFAALSFSVGGNQVDADSPTPMQAPSPTLVPTVAPGTSGIAVTYTFRGIPIIAITGPLHFAFVNGETTCGVLTPGVVYEAIVDGTLWPWDRPSNPPLCSQRGVSVRVCPRPTLCSDEFIYTGADVAVNLPVPADEFPAHVTLATAHFVHGAVPQTVTVTGWVFESGEYLCSHKFPDSASRPAVVSEVAHIWPTISQCSAPGQDVHVTFNTVEVGDLHATFQWVSGDVNYDVETGAFLQTPIPSPGPLAAAQPAPTAAELPRSGGMPPGHGLPLTEITFAVAAIGAGIGLSLYVLKKARAQ